jgi:hypothetical protein
MTRVGEPDDADADRGVTAFASENDSMRKPNSARPRRAQRALAPSDKDNRLD